MRTFLIHYFSATGRCIRRSLAQVTCRSQALAQASLGMLPSYDRYEVEEI